MKYRIVNRFRFITFVTVVILLIEFLLGSFFNRATAQGNDQEKGIKFAVCSQYAENSQDNYQKEYIQVNVAEGDTLWDIAKEYGAKTRDIREVVYDICKINNIKGSVICTGQTIIVPKE